MYGFKTAAIFSISCLTILGVSLIALRFKRKQAMDRLFNNEFKVNNKGSRK